MNTALDTPWFLEAEAERIAEAEERARSIDIDAIDPVSLSLFQANAQDPYFRRLREDDPVHYHESSRVGPYWSVTSYEHIKFVDTHHASFSSEPVVSLADIKDDFPLPMFIAMDQPRHDRQRKVAAPIVAPRNLKNFEEIIRKRAIAILENLPVGEPFNWVEEVSIELTTQMLTTLFDFPFEERRRLTRWSDVATGSPGTGIVESEEQRRQELTECLEFFTELWNQRVKEPPKFDLVSMLAHGESTRSMTPQEYLGNLVLLIVGGNDTTRNSIIGGLLALNQFPEQYDKLRADPRVIPNMVSEIVRWQTPVPHMRRTALEDTEVGGKRIRAGDKVAMWYLSGNRDENVFEDPFRLKVDRPNARNHLAFGFGIHRCMGNRLAEMQLRVLWEEILPRFKNIEVVGEPVRNRSYLIRGYTDLPVVAHAA